MTEKESRGREWWIVLNPKSVGPYNSGKSEYPAFNFAVKNNEMPVVHVVEASRLQSAERLISVLETAIETIHLICAPSNRGHHQRNACAQVLGIYFEITPALDAWRGGGEDASV